MQSLLQVASASAQRALEAQSVLANNLANADTSGFKADIYEAQSAYIVNNPLDGGSTSRSLPPLVDFTEGNIVHTGNNLDIAINGAGWLQVINPAGEIVLSRRGDLRVDAAGFLLDGKGNQVMGGGGPIALPPFSSLSIGSDGTVSIVPLGEPPTAVVVLDRLFMVNPAQEDLTKGVDGLFRHPDIGVLPPDAEVRLVPGALEASNVNPITAMVEMIELSREFEGHIQALKSADELQTSSASLMRLE